MIRTYCTVSKRQTRYVTKTVDHFGFGLSHEGTDCAISDLFFGQTHLTDCEWKTPRHQEGNVKRTNGISMRSQVGVRKKLSGFYLHLGCIIVFAVWVESLSLSMHISTGWTLLVGQFVWAWLLNWMGRIIPLKSEFFWNGLADCLLLLFQSAVFIPL